MNQQIAASNRKAYHEYHILDKYEAGIELFGTEVKSLREAQANLKESYVIVRKNQAWISGMHINRYSNTGHEGHDPTRNRRLLLNKREISNILEAISQQGLTCVLTSIYWKENKIKCDIAIGKGKKTYDQREDVKQRDWNREKQRILKNSNR